MPGSNFNAMDDWEDVWREQKRRDENAKKALEDLKVSQAEALKAFQEEVRKQVGALDPEKMAALANKLRTSSPGLTPDPEPIEGPCVITVGNNQRAIRCVGEAAGKPFIALITGRGGQYKWERKWVGQRTSRSRSLMQGQVELVAGFGSLGSLPAALDIRWGPTSGSSTMCVCRGFFRALAVPPYFEAISEQQVAFIVNQRVVEVPDRPVRVGRRAPINFDEEV